MTRHARAVPVALALLLPLAAAGQEAALSDTDLSGLALRNIGPAINSGRIADIAIHPADESVWYVGVGSGGVWKTVNDGTTFEPIFDDQPVYSIGSVAIDPSAPDVVWVGTGENVGGRHVGFGDGVYRSGDGGRTWENMGLPDSEHLSTIIVHPEDSDVVWVAAQGPLWTPGGQRGVYKTDDGGETWRQVLGNDEWTGATDLAIDPEDPDRLYAATWDRHRTVAAYFGGGPGSGIHRSEDGGETWTELTTGLPEGPLGKIGLAVSPMDPDRVYAAIETVRTEGGLWMSEDRGGSWRKMSDAVSGGTGPHYYQELYASPHREGRLYLVSNVTQISDDHGATFRFMDLDQKHSDDHAIDFKESDPDYVLVGSDGGLYESLDDMETWSYKENLPVMQYYKISVDDSEPFYRVFGGTQDNGSNGGPTRTTFEHGIGNRDWFKTLGADGHDSATEPGNPDIVYAETQQGGLHRIDMTTRDAVFIQPQARQGEPHERFNWDAPIEVSSHEPSRIYHASYRVWRSDDRGDSWRPVSGDLTRGEERVERPIMGRRQSWDGAWDVGAMSNYNTVTSLGESPVDEEVLWAGTDDGLLWVTENGGDDWRRIEVGTIPGVPTRAFVNDVKADLFDRNTVYVALDHHKSGDFSPYLVKSADLGRTWTSVAGDLPDRHLVWRVVQDHVDPALLFAATEFGLFATVDGGARWVEIPGAPTISFRDVDIQRTHEDVVVGSFGRGIFVLDDYTPLRRMTPETLAAEAALFDPRPAFWYLEDEVSEDQGHDEYYAPNPPFGAVFTYYLRDGYRSLEAERRAREGEIPEGEDVPFPGWDALEAEMRQQAPAVQVVVRDASGAVVNRVDGPASAGVHRVAWGLEHAPRGVVDPEDPDEDGDFLARPGRYTAELVRIEDGRVTTLDGPVDVRVVPLRDGALPRVADDVVASFRREVEAFQRELTTVEDRVERLVERVEALQVAHRRAENPDPALAERLHDARMELLEIRERVEGSEARDEIGERDPPTPDDRLDVAAEALETTYGPTPMHREMLQVGRAELAPIRQEVEAVSTTVEQLEEAVAATGAPPVGGRR